MGAGAWLQHHTGKEVIIISGICDEMSVMDGHLDLVNNGLVGECWA